MRRTRWAGLGELADIVDLCILPLVRLRGQHHRRERGVRRRDHGHGIVGSSGRLRPLPATSSSASSGETTEYQSYHNFAFFINFTIEYPVLPKYVPGRNRFFQTMRGKRLQLAAASRAGMRCGGKVIVWPRV